ncbi:MAG: SRPBCC family protein [Chloroflexota bacterium]
MPSANRTITINKPIADVFAFVTDGANAQKWRSGVLDTSHVSGNGVGEQWSQGVQGPGGRRIAADYQVTAYDAPNKMAFKTTAGPVRPTGSYVLTSAGDDATNLTFSLDAQVGGLKGLLMGGAVQKTMDAEMAALDRLKSVLES